jgi:hypothetical protein
MPHLRLLIIAAVTILILTLAALALVGQTPHQPDAGDIIIIKGGSLEVQCGKNHGNDCLGTNDNKGKYKHKKDKNHIMEVVVKSGNGNVEYTGAFDAKNQPEIDITYK